MLNLLGERRLLSDDALHAAAEPQVIVGERHLDAGLGKRDKRHAVGRTEAIEELRRRRQQRPCAPEPDVALIDRDDDLPAVGWLEVGGVQRLEGIGRFPPRGFDVDLQVLGGHDPPRLAVNLDDEIGRQEVLDRHSLGVDHGDVDRNHVDAGAEGGTLGRRFSLLLGGQRGRYQPSQPGRGRAAASWFLRTPRSENNPARNASPHAEDFQLHPSCPGDAVGRQLNRPERILLLCFQADPAVSEARRERMPRTASVLQRFELRG